MFPYFGGKRRLAPTYPAPLYDTIVEPFAGGAAYGIHWLEKLPNLELIIVERDPTVAALWRALLEPDAAERVKAMPNVKHGDETTEPLIALVKGSVDRLSTLRKGKPVAVTEWMAERWPGVRNRVAKTCSLVFGRVTVVEGDYTDAPTKTATWFIDPPYQHQGHVYPHGSDALDYRELADWCQTRTGQVIVTEAKPADWLPFEPHHRLQNINNDQTTELVWYDPDHCPLRLFGTDET